MFSKEKIDELLVKAGLSDYKWIVPKTDIFVEQWVRFRCLFGCVSYGACGTCPPAVPPVSECREMIQGYDKAVLIHMPVEYSDVERYDAEIARIASAQLDLERDVFLSGCYKAFLLTCDDCHTCKKCMSEGTREKCLNKKRARPSIEAMGVDVYKTARHAGYDIDVVPSLGSVTNRFAILLLD